MPDPKNEKKPTEKKASAKPPRDLSKGAKTDVDLTQPITFNTDPTQINPNANVGAWNAYSKFLGSQTVNGQPLKGNANLNSAEAQAYTQKTIDDFNNSDYVKQFPNNKMTPEQITYAQQYHKRTDPNVQVDNWVGSQTSRFTYPTPQTLMIGDKKTLTPSDTSGFVPVVYGNKDYVIPAAKQATGKVNITDYVPYDPNVHGTKLQRGNVPSTYANRFPAPVTTNTTAPVIQQRAKGGLINKVKGYAVGGNVYFNEGFNEESGLNSGVIGQNDPYANQQAMEKEKADNEAKKKERQDKQRKIANGIGEGLGGVGSAYYNSQAPTSEGDAVRNTALATTSQMGGIGGVIGGIAGLADKFSKPLKTSSQKLDSNGNLVDESKAKRNASIGIMFSPSKRLTYKGGLTDITGKAYTDSLENKAKEQIADVQKANKTSIQEQAVANRNNNNFNGKLENPYDLENATFDENQKLILANNQQFDKNRPMYKKGGLVQKCKEGGSIKPKLTNNEVINKAKANGNNLDLNKYDKQRVDSMKKHIMEINKNKSNIMFPNIQMKSEGGEIEGEGGPKDDKIKAEVKEGSFVVPAENAELAKGIRKLYLKAPLKKAKLKQEGGEDVKLSDGEHLFTPEENEYLESIGVDLEELAPNAEKESDGYRRGGEVDGDLEKLLKQIEEIKKQQADAENQAKINEQKAKKSSDYKDKIASYEEAAMKDRYKKKALSDKELELKNAINEYKKEASKDPRYTPGGFGGVSGEKAKNLYSKVTKLADEYTKYANVVNPTKTSKQQNLVSTNKSNESYIKDTPSVYGSNSIKKDDSNNINNVSVKPSVKAPVYKAKSKEAVSDKGFMPKMTEDDGQFYSVPGDNLSPNERRVQTEKDNINNANAKKLNDSALAVGSQVVEVSKPTQKGFSERRGTIDPTLMIGAGQAAMGLKMLKGETRPIDNIKLDKAYNENVERSIKDASFGLTPEQKFQATQDIENAKRDAMFQGVNYSGGNASQAYNLNRSAINDAWKNKLGLKQADTDMRMQKQQYADQQVANRASVLSSNRRTMFNDAMEAFQQKQQAGSELVSTGLANSIGAYRFAKDQEERRKREGLDWSKNYQPPV